MNSTAHNPTRTRRLLYYASFALAIGVGALQMFRVRGGLVTSYGADLFGPAWIYWTWRANRPGRFSSKLLGTEPPPPTATAVVVFLLCVAWEICQLYDWSGTPLAITRGKFDPIDIACYGVGLLVCWLLDVRLEGRTHAVA